MPVCQCIFEQRYMEMSKNGDHQQSNTLNECNVRKRGFTHREALGGHMATHGIRIFLDHEENTKFHNKVYQQEDDNNKHFYFLQTSTNRFISSKALEASCDKMYMSWPGKCTFDHMSSRLRRYVNNDNKSCATSYEEEDLTNCLVMLSSNIDAFSSNMYKEGNISTNPTITNNYRNKEMVNIDIQEKVVFKCKSCKKIFSSHQALGGHRASHKKVKGCFASGIDNLTDEDPEEVSSSNKVNVYQCLLREDIENEKKKSQLKVHQCSVCYRIFSSGQALGGHKRCHWLTSNNNHPSIDHHYDDQVKYERSTKRYLPSDTKVNMEEEDKEEHEEVITHQTEENGKKKKVTKLSGLRDIDLDGKSSSWLHLGITSTSL